MPTLAQIRGMLLEEALLYLLRFSGYQTITNADPNQDPTLINGPSGIEVYGRGMRHQIDAIADFSISAPFSNPQRLLVEAKCYRVGEPVKIDIIRNAVGVLKDVSEFWSSSSGQVPLQKRFHYQYAIFSASGYTDGSERYAFAQDIFLIPLEDSQFIQPILNSIRSIDINAFGISLSELRKIIRSRLNNLVFEHPQGLNQDAFQSLEEFVVSVHKINGALLGMINRRFPVFLVPSPNLDLSNLRNHYTVRIYRPLPSDNHGWLIAESGHRNPNDLPMFSFDIPPDLFELYAEGGYLSPLQAANMKQEAISHIQAIITSGGYPRVITLDLDMGWINQVRDNLEIKKMRRNG